MPGGLQCVGIEHRELIKAFDLFPCGFINEAVDGDVSPVEARDLAGLLAKF